MTKKQQEEFINKPCDDNTTWAAQQILESLPPAQRYQIVWAIKKLYGVLYKDWARGLTLRELLEAVNMLSSHKEGTGI